MAANRLNFNTGALVDPYSSAMSALGSRGAMAQALTAQDEEAALRRKEALKRDEMAATKQYRADQLGLQRSADTRQQKAFTRGEAEADALARYNELYTKGPQQKAVITDAATSNAGYRDALSSVELTPAELGADLVRSGVTLTPEQKKQNAPYIKAYEAVDKDSREALLASGQDKLRRQEELAAQLEPAINAPVFETRSEQVQRILGGMDNVPSTAAASIDAAKAADILARKTETEAATALMGSTQKDIQDANIAREKAILSGQSKKSSTGGGKSSKAKDYMSIEDKWTSEVSPFGLTIFSDAGTVKKFIDMAKEEGEDPTVVENSLQRGIDTGFFGNSVNDKKLSTMLAAEKKDSTKKGYYGKDTRGVEQAYADKIRDLNTSYDSAKTKLEALQKPQAEVDQADARGAFNKWMANSSKISPTATVDGTDRGAVDTSNSYKDTNNLANLRVTDASGKRIPWEGSVESGPSKEFTNFDSPEAGARAAYIQLDNNVTRGADTLNKLISKHAPSSENNTDTYIKNVSDWTGIDPNKKLTKNDYTKVVKAMARQEHGKEALDTFNDDVLSRAYDTAFTSSTANTPPVTPVVPVQPRVPVYNAIGERIGYKSSGDNGVVRDNLPLYRALKRQYPGLSEDRIIERLKLSL